MSPFTRTVAAAAVTVLGCCLAASCGDAEQTGGPRPVECLEAGKPVALVAGIRSNSPQPRLPEQISEIITGAADAGQQITLVRLDGDPKTVFAQRFTTGAGNSAGRDEDLRAFTGGVAKAMKTGMRASAPEADVLGALTLAAESVPEGGDIVLLDSGLQTTAGLDFRDGILGADPDEVVDYLKKTRLLPDLRGRHVLLSGIGYTAPPQPKLDTRLRGNLAAIWQKIATAAGAVCVSDLSGPNTGDAPAGLPSVSTVTPPPPAVFKPCGDTALGDKDHVGFVQGTARYRDKAGAEKTLGRLVDEQLRSGHQKIELIGATSSEGDDASNQRLSEERAAAVRDTLVQLGVGTKRITVKGAGEHYAERVDDVGPGGALLPGPAARNRVVIVRLTCPPR